MRETKKKATRRTLRQPVDKFGERRDELAEAALQTLSELGYARTSLREIAQNTKFSLGVLHYYFTDKVDLIMYCVRQYKARCVTRYDEIVASAKTAGELRRGFASGMAETLKADAAMHRLWYDLRTQSLFEESFRKDVSEIDHSLERMIWRIVTEYATLSGATPRLPSSLTYALFDGVFQQSLRKHLHGEPGAIDELKEHVERLLSELASARPEAVSAPNARRPRPVAMAQAADPGHGAHRAMTAAALKVNRSAKGKEATRTRAS